MIYLLIHLLVIGCVCYFDFRHVPCTRRSYKEFYILTYLVLAIVPGISYRLGVDIPSYMREFDLLPPIGSASLERILESSSREMLWVLFSSTCKGIADNFGFMHTMQALIFNGTIFYFVSQHTERRFIAIAFYFFGFWVHINFGGLREGLAMVFFFLAMDQYLKTGNLFKYILIAIPALFFHKFSFIPILLTPFAFLLKKHKVVSFLLVIGIYILSSYIIEAVLPYMWRSEDDLLELAETRAEEEQYSIFGMLQNVVVRATPPLVVLYLIGKIDGRRHDSYVLLLYMCAFVGMISSFIPLLNRCYFYFLPILAVCVGKLIDGQVYKRKKFRLHFAFLAFAFLWFAWIGIGNYIKPSAIEYRSNVKYNAALIPYHTVFTEQEDPIREGLPRR